MYSVGLFRRSYLVRSPEGKRFYWHRVKKVTLPDNEELDGSHEVNSNRVGGLDRFRCQINYEICQIDLIFVTTELPF